MQRPTAVTVIGGLTAISALWDIVLGLSQFRVAGLEFAQAVGYPSWMGSWAAMAIGLAAMMGAVVRVVFGVGMLQLKPWAWLLGVVLCPLYVVVFLFALGGGFTWAYLVNILLSLVVLGLLFTPRVMEAFDRRI